MRKTPDLVVLCENCHALFHANAQVNNARQADRQRRCKNCNKVGHSTFKRHMVITICDQCNIFMCREQGHEFTELRPNQPAYVNIDTFKPRRLAR